MSTPNPTLQPGRLGNSFIDAQHFHLINHTTGIFLL
jgi:hypothetical protein